MADFVKNLFGGAKAAVSSAVSSGDDAFADFATAVSPVAPAHAATSVLNAAQNTQPARPLGLFAPPGGMAGRPYTKWYRIWERTTLADFYQELVILPFVFLIFIMNVIGSRMNKSIIRKWAATYVPLLATEFASVGFAGKSRGTIADTTSLDADRVLRKKAVDEYTTYATGRTNVACLDIKLTLHRRHNPFMWFGEALLAFLMDAYPAPEEKMQATAICFDGKEKDLLPRNSGSDNSTFDGFVWAVVHKDQMKRLRNDRYDVSLTTTRESPKLPNWVTVMSESAEITDVMLTPELIKAVEEAGDDLEALIVTDQPIDAPKKLDDVVPKKRVSLSMKLKAKPTSTKLFEYFLRLPDQLVSHAHFRAEAMRKVRATREEEMRKIRKIDEEEKAEERRTASDKLKKEERDRRLSRMSADEQRKFLDRERQSEMKKSNKRQTMRA